MLNKEENAERVILCSDWLVSPPNSKMVIFNDEEKFNLDVRQWINDGMRYAVTYQ